MNYLQKLKNPKWQKKRLEILDRDKFTCRICGDDKNTLHVHHHFYEKGKEPWEYEDNVLITVCEKCHKIETQFAEEVNQYINELRLSGWTNYAISGLLKYGLKHNLNDLSAICPF